MTHYKRGTHPNSLKNLGKTKYTVDEGFFDIPNPLNSYFAGFLAADGCMLRDNKTMQFALQERDRVVLEQLNKAMTSTYPIHHYLSHGFPTVVTRWVSKHSCDSLRENYSITPCKSLTLQPPVGLSFENQAAFVKGYIDGDGTIRVRDNTKLVISALGTRDVMSYLRDWSEQVTGCDLPEPRKERNMWVFSISDTRARCVFEYLYTRPFGLSRKWNENVHDLCVNWRWRNGKYLRYIPQYRDIHKRLYLGQTVDEIAAAHGCSPANIYATIRGENYNHFIEFESQDLDKEEE